MIARLKELGQRASKNWKDTTLREKLRSFCNPVLTPSAKSARSHIIAETISDNVLEALENLSGTTSETAPAWFVAYEKKTKEEEDKRRAIEDKRWNMLLNYLKPSENKASKYNDLKTAFDSL